jgi:beta-xylosidase
MDDQKDIVSTESTSPEASIEAEPKSASAIETSTPENSLEKPTGKPPEDIREPETNKEEATAGSPESEIKSKVDPSWRTELKRFHDDINLVLASKENLRLVAIDIKVPQEFAEDWKLASNRYFKLMVNLRKRYTGVKVAQKHVA